MHRRSDAEVGRTDRTTVRTIYFVPRSIVINYSTATINIAEESVVMGIKEIISSNAAATAATAVQSPKNNHNHSPKNNHNHYFDDHDESTISKEMKIWLFLIFIFVHVIIIAYIQWFVIPKTKTATATPASSLSLSNNDNDNDNNNEEGKGNKKNN